MAKRGPGVFSLDDLLALGQTGDPSKDFMAGGPDRTAIPDNLPAGYYRIPGAGLGDGNYAIYVDPRSGKVPREFVDFVNAGKLTRNPITKVPDAFLSETPEEATAKRFAYSPEFEEQLRLEGLGLSREEAQNLRLSRQQAAAGGTGVEGTTLGKAKQVNAPASSAGAYQRFLDLGGNDDMLKTPAFAGYEPERAAALKDALAFNFMQNYSAMEGLKKNRAAKGLDPETGISQAEKSRIFETYQQISDPQTKAEYLFYQDPGNLTPELRALRDQARTQESEFIAANAPQADEYRRVFGEKGASALFRVGKGSVTASDEATGRKHVYGNVPVSVEQVEEKRDAFAAAARRVGGGVIGATMGFMTGGVAGAAIGAYTGAGGWMPKAAGLGGGVLGAAVGFAMSGGSGWGAMFGAFGGVGGVKGAKKARFDDVKGLGNWTVQEPGAPSMKDFGASLAFARFSGGGVFGKGWGTPSKIRGYA